MSIDQFHELQQQMEQFQDNLHRVLEEKKRLLLGTVEAYHEDVTELRSRQEELSKKIQGLQLNQSELQNDIESSQTLNNETTAKLEAFAIKKHRLEKEKQTLLDESRELDQMLLQKQKEIQHRKELLVRQKRKDYPEVAIYEQLLGLQLDSSQPETLQFRFARVRETDLTATCLLVLNVSHGGYRVASTSPPLPASTTEALESQFNSTGDLPRFLKRARTELAAALETR